MARSRAHGWRLIALAACVANAAGTAFAWTTLLNGSKPQQTFGGATAVDAFGATYVGGRGATDVGIGPLLVKLVNDAEVWRYTGSVAANGSVSDLALDPTGNPVLGTTDSAAATASDWAVTKLDADTGAVLWRTTLDGGSAQYDYFFALDVDASGDVLVSGQLYDALGPHFAVVRFDGATGGEKWRHVVATTDMSDRAHDVVVGADGDVYACGTYGGNFVVERLAAASGAPVFAATPAVGVATVCSANPASIDAAGSFKDPAGRVLGAARIATATGAPIWAYAASGDDMGFKLDDARALTPATDGSGDVFVGGVIRNTATSYDAFLARIDGAGTDVWFKIIDGGAQTGDSVSSIAIDASGHPVVAGYVGTADETVDAALWRLDPATGNVLWTARFDGAGHRSDSFGTVVTTPGGDLVVSGTTFDGADSDRLFAARVRADDGAEQARFVAGSAAFLSQDQANAIARDTAGDLLVGGWLEERSPSFSPPSRFTVAKFDGRRGVERWRYEPPGEGLVTTVAVQPDGNLLAAGELAGPPDDLDATVVKLAPDGRVLWTRQFSGGAVPPEDDVLNAVVSGGDGSIYAAGTLRRPGTSADLFVVKLAPDGTELWRRLYASDGNEFDEAVALALEANGDVVVGGSVGPGAVKWLVMRLAAADGGVVWSTILAGTEPVSSSVLKAIAIDPITGDVVGVGSLGNADTSTDFGIVRLRAADGLELWRASYDGAKLSGDQAQAVMIDATGEILAAGFVSKPTTLLDAFVVKLGPDKTQRWTHTAQLQTVGDDRGNAVAFAPSGDAVMLATVTSANGTDILFLGIDGAVGSEIWRRVLDGSTLGSNDQGTALIVDAGGGIAAAGAISTPGTNRDFAAIRLAARGVDAACVKNAPDDVDCRPCTDGCDDADPCTTDTCDATSFCAWTQVTGDPAVTCAFERTIPPTPCAGARVPRAIPKTYKRAGKAATRGVGAKKPAKATKSFRRASKLLDRMLTLIDKAERKKRRPLAADCAQALRSMAADAKTRVSARLAGA